MALECSVQQTFSVHVLDAKGTEIRYASQCARC